MARPISLPTLDEVFENPSILESLPAPYVEEVLKRLKDVEAQTVGGKPVPPSPVDFALQFPRWSWLDARHIHYLGSEIADCVRTGGARIVCMPPRHCKSTVCSIWTPFWFLADNPEGHILLTSYDDDFARSWGRKVRQLIELYGGDYGLHIDPAQAAGNNWALTSGGGMISAGVGGGIGGKPADLFIADDLIGTEDTARSQAVRDRTYDWWMSTALQRIEPTTATIVIATRWHEDDIVGRLIRDSIAGEGKYFDVISLPALAEANDPLGRSIDEGLWLEKIPQDWYLRRRDVETTAYTWSCVYQQRPSPVGGNMVDPSWWRFYRPSELPSKFDRGAQSWDLALDSLRKSDSYHCGGVLSQSGPLVYVRDAFHEHSDINRVMATIRAWNVLYPEAKQKLVERAISGPALVQMLRQEIGGIMTWPPKGHRKGSKEACLDACVPDIRSGHVLLPMNPDGSKARWVTELIEELRQFPRAPNDDYVDMLSQGVNFLSPSARRALSDSHSEALRSEPDRTSPTERHRHALHSVMQRLGQRNLNKLKRQTGQPIHKVLPFGSAVVDPAQTQIRPGRARRMW